MFPIDSVVTLAAVVFLCLVLCGGGDDNTMGVL